MNEQECTCHKNGTCRCMEISVRDGRGEPYCPTCGETGDHCEHGCTCQETTGENR